MIRGLLIALVLLAAGCKTWDYQADGKQHTGRSFCGVPVASKVSDIETPEMRKQRLSEERQEKVQGVGLKLSMLCFLAAVGCAIAGYVLQGWKFWGGLAGLMGACGIAGLAMVEFTPWLKFIIPGALLVGLVYTIYRSRDFSLFRRLKNVGR